LSDPGRSRMGREEDSDEIDHGQEP
jgi:hypothetical protein